MNIPLNPCFPRATVPDHRIAEFAAQPFDDLRAGTVAGQQEVGRAFVQERDGGVQPLRPGVEQVQAADDAADARHAADALRLAHRIDEA